MSPEAGLRWQPRSLPALGRFDGRARPHVAMRDVAPGPPPAGDGEGATSAGESWAAAWPGGGRAEQDWRGGRLGSRVGQAAQGARWSVRRTPPGRKGAGPTRAQPQRPGPEHRAGHTGSARPGLGGSWAWPLPRCSSVTPAFPAVPGCSQAGGGGDRHCVCVCARARACVRTWHVRVTERGPCARVDTGGRCVGTGGQSVVCVSLCACADTGLVSARGPASAPPQAQASCFGTSRGRDGAPARGPSPQEPGSAAEGGVEWHFALAAQGGPILGGHPGHPGVTCAGPASRSSRGRCLALDCDPRRRPRPRCTAWIEPLGARGPATPETCPLLSRFCSARGQRGARSPPAPSQSPRPPHPSCSAAAGSGVPAASPKQHHPKRQPVAPSPSPRVLRCGWCVLGGAFLAERPPFPPWEPGPSSAGSLTSAFSPLPGSGTLGGGDHPQSHLATLLGRRPASACVRGLLARGPG